MVAGLPQFFLPIPIDNSLDLLKKTLHFRNSTLLLSLTLTPASCNANISYGNLCPNWSLRCLSLRKHIKGTCRSGICVILPRIISFLIDKKKTVSRLRWAIPHLTYSSLTHLFQIISGIVDKNLLSVTASFGYELELP